MEFDDLEGYRAYGVHPVHDAFSVHHGSTMVDAKAFDFEPLAT